MDPVNLTDTEFHQFSNLVMELSGISLTDSKKALVCGRLAKRLREYNLDSYGAYFKLLTDPSGREELQIALDLLTTNETYFFREPAHFDYIKKEVLLHISPGTYRVWSAACSSGEEPYTLAMVLSESLGSRSWEIIASDLSSRMLARARTGLYTLERKRHIPQGYFERYCEPVANGSGEFTMEKRLRRRVHFSQINLISPYPDIGEFDLIFLRNVMIYFELETKKQVVMKMLSHLKKGGYFVIGHSENLHGIGEGLENIKPSIFRKI
ncbi:MAG TPA: protein-glutamate O-methyltransferase CheR [Burkholderiales bacterium]|nr:protein-glutamate O-methyltransferase CheR [Burkholderiales bacterium]